MSMATSLEKRIKDAAKNLASGGSPMPVNVIRNHEEPTPTPTVSYTLTFVDATTPPYVAVMPDAITVSSPTYQGVLDIEVDPTSGNDYVFSGWSTVQDDSSKTVSGVLVDRDMLLYAIYEAETPVGPEQGSFMGSVSGEIGSISIYRGKGGSDLYPVEATVYDSNQEEVVSGSLAKDGAAPLVLSDADLVAGTYTVHIVWTPEGTNGYYDDKEVEIAAADPQE